MQTAAVEVDWFPVTRARQNCSLLRCEESGAAAVIDPGGDIEML